MAGQWSSRALGAAVVVVAVFLSTVVVPILWAASKYKTLYKFKGGNDGSSSTSALIFDMAGNLYGTTNLGGNGGAGTVFKMTPSGNGRWTESVLYPFKKDGTDGADPVGGLTFDGAGNLYGTTAEGGMDNVGTVFGLTPNGDGSWTETVLHSFKGDGMDGYSPLATLVLDSAGNLYGTTVFGGAHGAGAVFEVTRNADGSWTENVLHSFTYTDGAYPFAVVIFDANGNLYSTTQQGGAYGDGTVFKLTPNGGAGWTETVLHSFDLADGAGPDAGLVFDSAGNLYGTTEGGGNLNQCVNYGGGCGVVFQLRPHADGSWKEKVLHKFTQNGTARLPIAGVIFDAAGNLYGTTYYGGSDNDYGTLFKLTPAIKGLWKETVLHSFRNRPGAHPSSGLTSDGQALYGTTTGDGATTFGSVFEIVP
jgi:uncharacterized repeat protein (TIGR03803 family)